MASRDSAPAARAYLERVANVLQAQVKTTSFRYLERAEEYFVNADYSLTLKRRLRLRWLGKEPLCCIETGCWAQASPADPETVQFDVEAPAGGPQPFAVPDLARWPATRALFLVGLAPPLGCKKEITLTMTWQWPEWWSRLRADKRDEVEVRIGEAGPVDSLSFQLFRHHAIGKTAVTCNRALGGGPKQDVREDFHYTSWQVRSPAEGKYLFACTRE